MSKIKDLHQIARYVFFGLLSAGLEFLLFTAIAGMVHLYIASVVSFSAGLITSFIFNKFLVFKKSNQIHKTEVIQFTLLGILNSQVSSFMTVGLAIFLPVTAAKIITMTFVAVWNYLLMRFVIFKLPRNT